MESVRQTAWAGLLSAAALTCRRLNLLPGHFAPLVLFPSGAAVKLRSLTSEPFQPVVAAPFDFTHPCRLRRAVAGLNYNTVHDLFTLLDPAAPTESKHVPLRALTVAARAARSFSTPFNVHSRGPLQPRLGNINPTSACIITPGADSTATEIARLERTLLRDGLLVTVLDRRVVTMDPIAALSACDLPICLEELCADLLGAALLLHPRGLLAPLLHLVDPVAADNVDAARFRQGLLWVAGVRYIPWAALARSDGAAVITIDAGLVAPLVRQLTHRAESVKEEDKTAGGPASQSKPYNIQQPQFLLFMPWEQLNNQLIALRCACAVARLLGRTLVLPKVGRRRPRDASSSSSTAQPEWDFSFNIEDFLWDDYEVYFDVRRAVTGLPCRVITLDAFLGITLMGRFPLAHASSDERADTSRPDSNEPEGNDMNISLASSVNLAPIVPPWWPLDAGHAVFNPVAKATSPAQLRAYYTGVLGLSLASILDHSRLAQLSDADVLRLWGPAPVPAMPPPHGALHQQQQPPTVLALGATFWLYAFNRSQPYPLTEFADYLDHPVYAAAADAVRPHPRLRARAAAIAAAMRYSASAPTAGSSASSSPLVVALHVRRGDYWNKCKHIRTPALRRKCYPSDVDIAAAASAAAAAAAVDDGNGSFARPPPPPRPVVVYVATNDPPSVRHGGLDELLHGVGVPPAGAAGSVSTPPPATRVVLLDDIAATDAAVAEALRGLDAVETALVEAELCASADA
ncbi:hypothetical protein HK405_009351, partial [Cladochytrium tenue]